MNAGPSHTQNALGGDVFDQLPYAHTLEQNAGKGNNRQSRPEHNVTRVALQKFGKCDGAHGAQMLGE